MRSLLFRLSTLSAACVAVTLLAPAAAGAQATCARTLTADVVALDQVFFWNRLGAVQPQGMMFALRRDVVAFDGSTNLTPGNVQLRPEKRPRPLVLRMNVGDCLRIQFQNLLEPLRVDRDQNATRMASVHVNGLQLTSSTLNDGSQVGANPPGGLVNPGLTATYTLYAEREGEHVLFSAGAAAGGEGDGGQINAGLFGSVIVEPAGSLWYRSQVTEEDLRYATTSTNASGFPVLNYDAVYPVGHRLAGQPVLKMLNGTQIIRSDLTAIITGASANNGGNFGATAFPANANTYPHRREPFRELVIHYHDETGAVQAFPEFYDAALEHTLHSVRDAFAINYGSAGTGAEVLANRLGVGPVWKCPECKFEEFFLSSWAVGDPAMVVDVPANSPCAAGNGNDPNAGNQNSSVYTKANALRDKQPCTPTSGRKAAKAFYPDDPSNVYHSYLSDHVKFRVLHAGSKEHHIHHLHAHQWLYSPDNDKSSYLDSQAIGPGASFTAEIAHEGSGNLNQTVGDSIFHCHFYPHFAQGMWSLWRVHDVLEKGTVMDAATGRPAAGSRALPDGEIAAGTPIPGLVPLPGKPMAPIPAAVSINGSTDGGQIKIVGTGNPGYPFFVPAKAGNRPPHPPLDTIDDGGLKRHRIDRAFDAYVVNEAHTRKDFHKVLQSIQVVGVAETGTDTELAAMAFHAQREHPTCKPDGTCDSTTAAVKFITNGQPGVAGAPFADPCIDANGNPVGNPRLYKAAAIQADVTSNKAGWHTPQQRFFSLWQDVSSFLTGGKPPEPLFIRSNSRDCIEYQLTNLVPGEYKLDDFQVRTPTDVLGQHIHLVKFDVLASDGAGNGFNYEDGAFSPDEVRERIDAIRVGNACTATDTRNGTLACPVAKVHPFFGAGPNNAWLGAQTVVQRWYADPVQDNAGNDRTLRTVFTHDHFGPSTHQQTGLYAGLVVEPTGSTWVHNETGATLGTGRSDGGPTSWQAVIDPPNEPDYREFLLAFNDYQPSYPQGATYPSPTQAINPPARDEILLTSGSNDLIQRATICPGGGAPPCPEAISSMDVGTMTVNYRNEPAALRLYDPVAQALATGNAGDSAMVFNSRVTRADTRLNAQPTFYQPLTGDLLDKDPYTPLLRAYENDRVQIRVLVGGHEEGHNFSVHGIKWLQEPSNPDSGYRNSQMMGISEHFEFIVPQLVKQPSGSAVDRLWSAGSSTDDLWNGLWGLFRAYTGKRPDLASLPENPNGRSNLDPSAVGNFDFSCPNAAVQRAYNVSAITARSLTNHGYGSKLVYNERTDGAFGALSDPTAILYVYDQDLDLTGTVPQLKTTARLEPLVLRARAGECVVVNLTNRIGARTAVDGYNTLPMLIDGFNANDLIPSGSIGLHPQMLYYDPSRYDGISVGNNGTAASQMVSAGQTVTYKWYAGDIRVNADGTVTATPIEFGATNLISSDRLLHASKGAIGALIIEPADATWTVDTVTETLPTSATVSQTQRASARVTSGGTTFREHVLQFQNDVNMRMGALSATGEPVRNLGGEEDAEDSGQDAVNYRSEPLWKRMQYAPETPFASTDDFNKWDSAAWNGKVGGVDPETPIFTARPGEPVRFRLLQSGGHSRNMVFTLYGHVWDRQPYLNSSTQLGQNTFSFWEGAHMGHGPTNHADLLLRNGAGGAFKIQGDYLFRDFAGPGFDGGLWGLLRVAP